MQQKVRKTLRRGRAPSSEEIDPHGTGRGLAGALRAAGDQGIRRSNAGCCIRTSENPLHPKFARPRSDGASLLLLLSAVGRDLGLPALRLAPGPIGPGQPRLALFLVGGFVGGCLVGYAYTPAGYQVHPLFVQSAVRVRVQVSGPHQIG